MPTVGRRFVTEMCKFDAFLCRSASRRRGEKLVPSGVTWVGAGGWLPRVTPSRGRHPNEM